MGGVDGVCCVACNAETEGEAVEAVALSLRSPREAEDEEEKIGSCFFTFCDSMITIGTDEGLESRSTVPAPPCSPSITPIGPLIKLSAIFRAADLEFGSRVPLLLLFFCFFMSTSIFIAEGVVV